MSRLASVALATCILAALPAEAQESKRLAIPVKFGSAKDLAAILTKHIKESDFQAVAEPTSNTLLLNGSKATLAEVLDLLEQLDRPPRQVAVDIWIAEAKEGDFSLKELEGPLAEIRTRLGEWQAKGRLPSLRHFELKASENQPATISNLGMHHYVSGVAAGFGGKAKMTYSMSVKNIGTKLTVTPRISPEKEAVLHLNLEDARAFTPDDGVVLGTDDKGLPIRATDFVTSQVEAKISVPSGRALVVEGVTNRSKSGTGRTLVIVGARLLDAASEKGK